MKIKTRFFGEIEIDNNKIITFQDGLPGFEHLKNFLFMTDKDENSPFCWLQSIEDVDIVFTLFNVFNFLPNYNPNIEKDMLKDLEEFKEEDFIIYCIATIPKDIKEITINLKAPVIINLANNKAKQIICNNEEYPIKYYIYKEMKKAGE